MDKITLVTPKLRLTVHANGLSDVSANLKKFVTEIQAEQAGLALAKKYGKMLYEVLTDPAKLKQAGGPEITESLLKKLSKPPRRGYNKAHGSTKAKAKTIR